VGGDATDSDSVGGTTGNYTLVAGETNLTVDAGFYRPAALGDFVWKDLNSNGVQDAGEPGIQGVLVTLQRCDGSVVTTTTTDVNGKYLFSNLLPGCYRVAFATPTGMTAGPANSGSNDALDSDSVGGVTGNYTLAAGETNLTVDAGFYTAQASPGTGTPGYWKNHPEAWPVQSIVIGGRTYTKAQAIALIEQPDGDKTYTLFRALVSAKLNVLIGNNSSCVADTIIAADAWLATYPAGSGVAGSSQAWKIGEPLYLRLDAYNNGALCAPHRN
jgi:hypothetical protein